MEVKLIDITRSECVKAQFDYKEYLIKLMCAIYGIPRELLSNTYPIPNETLCQKIKRNARSLIFKLGEIRGRLKRRGKKDNDYYPPFSREAIYWMMVIERISNGSR